MVVDKLDATRVDVVFAIVVIPDEKSLTGDDSHLVIDPVLPLKVNEEEFVPVQTEVLPETVPPTEIGFTVIVTENDDVDEQDPFVTTTR